jgi:hypothetical protein
MVFVISFALIRTSNHWSTVNNWKRIGLELFVSAVAFIVTTGIIAILVIFFD